MQLISFEKIIVNELVSTFKWNREKHSEIIEKVKEVLKNVPLEGGLLMPMDDDGINNLIFFKKNKFYKFCFFNSTLETFNRGWSSRIYRIFSLKKEYVLKIPNSPFSTMQMENEHSILTQIHKELFNRNPKAVHRGFVGVPKCIFIGNKDKFICTLQKSYKCDFFHVQREMEKRDEEFCLTQRLFFVHQLVCSIADLHALNFVYGDLKEDNIFVRPYIIKWKNVQMFTYKFFLGDMGGACKIDDLIEEYKEKREKKDWEEESGTICPGKSVNILTTNFDIVRDLQEAVGKREWEKARSYLFKHDVFGVGVIAFSIFTEEDFIDYKKYKNIENVGDLEIERLLIFQKKYEKKMETCLSLFEWVESLLMNKYDAHEALEGLLRIIQKQRPMLYEYLASKGQLYNLCH